MRLALTIPGQPIAQNRPRFARRGKHVCAYSDQEEETGLWVLTARDQVKKALVPGQGVVVDCPVGIKLKCYLKRPAGHWGSGRNAMKLKPTAPAVPGKKPDLDNYIKFALDCLNHCGVWADDSVVVWIVASKLYADRGEEARTNILITTANDIGE